MLESFLITLAGLLGARKSAQLKRFMSGLDEQQKILGMRSGVRVQSHTSYIEICFFL